MHYSFAAKDAKDAKEKQRIKLKTQRLLQFYVFCFSFVFLGVLRVLCGEALEPG
jgi:hypothetical protein